MRPTFISFFNSFHSGICILCLSGLNQSYLELRHQTCQYNCIHCTAIISSCRKSMLFAVNIISEEKQLLILLCIALSNISFFFLSSFFLSFNFVLYTHDDNNNLTLLRMVQLKTNDHLYLNCCQKYNQCMGKLLVYY